MSMRAQGDAIKVGQVLMSGVRLLRNHKAVVAHVSGWLVPENSSARLLGGIEKAA